MAEVDEIRDRLDTVLATIGGQSPRCVVLDLDDPGERDGAEALRHRAQDGPENPNRANSLRWAKAAERLHSRIHKAL